MRNRRNSLPTKFKKLGTKLYSFEMHLNININKNIDITVQIITQNRLVYNASSKPSKSDYVYFIKRNNCYELYSLNTNQLPKDNKKLGNYKKDFRFRISLVEEIYVETLNLPVRGGFFKIGRKNLEDLANQQSIINTYSFKPESHGEFLKIPAYELLRVPKLWEYVDVNNMFINIDEFGNKSIGFLIKLLIEDPLYNRNDTDIYFWFYDPKHLIYYRAFFCLNQTNFQDYEMLSVNQLIEKFNNQHLKTFGTGLPRFVAEELNTKNSLIATVVGNIKKSNIKFTKSVFCKKLHDLAKHRSRKTK